MFTCKTFTFLDRNTERNVARAWKDALKVVPRLRVWPSTSRDLEHAWTYFDRPDLHKLQVGGRPFAQKRV